MITPDVMPEDVASYLSRLGWVRRRAGSLAEVWAPRDDEATRVLIPLAPDAFGFSQTMNLLTLELSRYEQRPEDEIKLEISRQFLDVTDLRAEGDDIDEGTISLEAGLGLLNAANRLMVSAAAATLHRQGHYGKSMPRKAYDHARRLRLGQTRRGSYILPIISNARIAPVRFIDDEPQLEIESEDSYFDRRVLATLSHSLGTLSELTMNRDRTPTRAEVEDSVGEGVSSELCGAVLEVVGKAAVGALDVTFNWAPASPVPDDLVRNVTFVKEYLGILEDVKSRLATTESKVETALYGFIRSMQLKANESSGRVSLETVVDDRKRFVSFDLDLATYRRAARYHGDRRPVIVTGVLDAPRGKSATMKVRTFGPDRSIIAAF